MKKVYSARDALEARLVVGHLADHGIDAIVQGEELWSARGELPLTPDTAPSVWVVEEADVDEAIRLILEKQGPANPATCVTCGHDLQGLAEPRCPECGRPFRRVTSWQCRNCGERLESTFSHCWKCGTVRPQDPPDVTACE